FFVVSPVLPVDGYDERPLVDGDIDVSLFDSGHLCYHSHLLVGAHDVDKGFALVLNLIPGGSFALPDVAELPHHWLAVGSDGDGVAVDYRPYLLLCAAVRRSRLSNQVPGEVLL